MPNTALEPEPYVEVDPSGRYGRYGGVLLGSGSVKKVYRAYDNHEAIQVAWNKIRLPSFSDDPAMLARVYAEVHLLRSLRHPGIIALHAAWTDPGTTTLNFITEACTSGDLRAYRRLHPDASPRSIKKWSRQILAALAYLHARDACVIHRDLNLSNVFVNGNTGEVKIGDFGLATTIARNHAAHSILGTPEFMAPEQYEDEYNELVDVYSFGMCVLEMVTMKIPYSECQSVSQIYRKVTAGVRPEAMEMVKDPEFRAFIERCLARPDERPSAEELLKDPFFHGIDDGIMLPELALPVVVVNHNVAAGRLDD